MKLAAVGLVASSFLGCTSEEDDKVDWRCDVETDRSCHYYVVDGNSGKVIRRATASDLDEAGINDPNGGGGGQTGHTESTGGTAIDDGCCKHCGESQPCGDSCIGSEQTCHKEGGCACY